jgi:hypothetical protein
MPAAHLMKALRPDILAPSCNLFIISEIRYNQSAHYSGSSAAVAHTADAAVLFLEVIQGECIDSKQVMFTMQVSATPIYSQSSQYSLPFSYQQNEMINVNKLLYSSLYANTSIIIAADATGMPIETSKLSIVTDVPKGYKIIHKFAGTMITFHANTSRIDYSPDLMAQIIKGNSVDIPSGQGIQINITIQFPTLSISKKRIIYSGYIAFDSISRQSEEPSNDAIYIPHIEYANSI